VLRYRTALAASFFAAIFIASASKNNNDSTGVALATVVMTSIILKGYSQDQEKEADEMAMTHLKNTGYDYRIYKTLMGKFIDMRQRRIYTIEKIFSTHPTPEKRISHLDESLKNYSNLLTKLSN
jgi:predicted Zn-dependent protease